MHMRKKFNQVWVLSCPCFCLCFWLLSFLLSVFSAWVSWIIDVKHVHTLHTGILHHSPSLPDTCKGQPVTQPKEVNNIAGIANYIHNLQYWFSPLVMQYQLWHQCKTETLLWDSLIPRLCLPWCYKQSKLQVGKAWERIASSPNRKCVSETRLGYRVGQGFHFRLFQKQCGGGLLVAVHLFLQLSC